jgi:hypothetical protein
MAAFIARFSDELITSGSIDNVQAVGDTAEAAIAAAVEATGAPADTFQASPATDALVEESEDGPDVDWAWNPEARAYDVRIGVTVFGDGNCQGYYAEGFASTPEVAIAKVMSEFGRVISVKGEYMVEGANEVVAYEGDWTGEAEDEIPDEARIGTFDVQIEREPQY